MNTRKFEDTAVDAETIVRTYIYSKLQDSISVNTVDDPFLTVNDEDIQFEQLDAALVSFFGMYHESVETDTPAHEIVRAFAVKKLEEDQQYFDANEVIHTVNDADMTCNDIDAAITSMFEQHNSGGT